MTTPTSGRVHQDTKSWDDTHLISPYLYSRISAITVWAGPFVNGIQCTFEVYDEKQSKWLTIQGQELHGDHHGPSKQTVTLARDEHIVAVYGRYGAWVDHLRITTSKGNAHVFGGAGGAKEFNLPIPEKHRLMAFAGGVGGHLHNLGCTYAPSYPETWQPSNHHVYPPRFRAAIKALVMARLCNAEDMPRHPESPLHLLPPELFDVLVQLLAADPECWLV